MEDRKGNERTAGNPRSGNTAGTSDKSPGSAIGKRLKAYYDDVASEPVPDRFLSLLDALDAAEAVTKPTGRG